MAASARTSVPPIWEIPRFVESTGSDRAQEIGGTGDAPSATPAATPPPT